MLLTKIKPHIINKPEHKFETVLFLPEGEGRNGEGGLRTKGYFKHSYKLQEGAWWICDMDGNGVSSAPEEVQFKIHEYISEKKEKDSEITQLPLITVITVVFNGAKYLEETIESVINQTYPNVEYIIIDGGSTDGTLEIIKKYEDKIDYWVSEKDSGIYDAMNKGIRVACGEWVNFMNSGDLFEGSYIISDLFSILKLSQIRIIFGDTILIKDGKDVGYREFNNKRGLFIHQSVIYKIILHKMYGYYISNKHFTAADYFFIISCLDENNFVYVKKAFSKYNINGISNNPNTLYQKIFYDYLSGKLSLLTLSIILLLHPIYSWIKRKIKC